MFRRFHLLLAAMAVAGTVAAQDANITKAVPALERQLEAVQELAEAREKECLRWQAHYDLKFILF